MKRGFGSDNHSGISPEVLNAIADANIEHALAYGDDEYCARVEQLFKQHFGEQAVVSFVFNGTGANTMAIDAMVRSHEAVVCAETAHVNVQQYLVVPEPVVFGLPTVFAVPEEEEHMPRPYTVP